VRKREGEEKRERDRQTERGLALKTYYNYVNAELETEKSRS